MRTRARPWYTILTILALAGLGLVASASVESHGQPVKVFLCAGQSNMAGIGNRNGLDPADARLFPASAIRFWFASPGRDSASTEWTALGSGPGGFGPEQLFAIEMKRLFPHDQVAIVKVSRGATAINYWLPADGEGASHPLGHRTLAATIATVTRNLDREKAAGDIPVWAWSGFVWMQGEGDANGTLAPAGVYLEKLRQLATWVREQTGVADLPIVLGRISAQLSPAVVRDTGMLRVSKAKSPDGKGIADQADFLDDGQRRGPIWFAAKLAHVRADQEAFCVTDRRAAWVDIDDLPLRDFWHYDAGGYAEMGRRFARAYRGLTAPRTGAPATPAQQP
jgi:hypothetical protein